MKQPLYLEIRSQVINKQIKQWKGQFYFKCWTCLWRAEEGMSPKPGVYKGLFKSTENKYTKAFMWHALLFYVILRNVKNSNVFSTIIFF